MPSIYERELTDTPINNSSAETAHWATTFGASMTDISVLFKPIRNRTIRQLIPLAFGGSAVRLSLSNRFSTESFQISAASVMLTDEYSRPVASTIRELTFQSKKSVELKAGAEIDSDPVDLEIPADSNLIVDLFVEDAVLITTGTLSTIVQISLSEPGDNRGDPGVAFINQRPMNIGSATLPPPMLLLRQVDVLTSTENRTFVAFGDSLTQMGTWPSRFCDRLTAAGINNWSLVNAGISGNRIIHDAAAGPMSGLFGPSGVHRFATDALDYASVGAVTIFMGINDLTYPGTLALPGEIVSAEEMIAGLSGMAVQARKADIRVIGCTILPFTGADDIPSAAEAKRRDVNSWIRLTTQFDAVFDFDRALADPVRPERLKPEYDSGDHLHPNEAGGKAMANIIDLELFSK